MKRDRIEKIIVTEFLVWIVSSISVESSGACLKKKNLRQKPSYDRLKTPGSPVVIKQFFEIRTFLFHFLFDPYTFVVHNDVTST